MTFNQEKIQDKIEINKEKLILVEGKDEYVFFKYVLHNLEKSDIQILRGLIISRFLLKL